MNIHAINYKYLANKNSRPNTAGAVINFDFYVSKLLYLVLISAIFIFAAFYIIEINKLSYFGYQIRDYKKQLSELQEVNRRMEISAASKQSLFGLKEISSSLNMVESGKLNYIVVREESLGFVQSVQKSY